MTSAEAWRDGRCNLFQTEWSHQWVQSCLEARGCVVLPAARFAAAAASDGITMVTAIHEIVADGLCIFLASHVQRSGARAINISTTVAQWTAAATWYKRMCSQQRLFHLIFQRICSTAMALISQVFTADAWKHSWLPALRMWHCRLASDVQRCGSTRRTYSCPSRRTTSSWTRSATSSP